MASSNSRLHLIISIAACVLLLAVGLIALRFEFSSLALLLPVVALPGIYFGYRGRGQSGEAERLAIALKESEQLFRAAFNQSAGMGLTTSAGSWLKVNKSLCHILGCSEDELLEDRKSV